MKTKQPTEPELLENLDAYGAHADEVAEPLSSEYEPFRKLKGSVEKFERPTDPASVSEDWDAWIDGERASEDVMNDHGEKR
jgi:antitoxin VapB